MVNTDPRYLEARKVLDATVPGTPVKLYKTTRAGATTGLCANAIDSNQTFCLIAPTKKIAHETINSTEEHANRKGAVITKLVSNHMCIKIKNKIEKYPDLGKLPIIPLQGYCTNCEYRDECEVTKFILADRQTLDGVGMTYHKLMAIVLSESQSAMDIMDKIAEVIDVFVFDEADYYETPKPVSVQVYPPRDIEYLITQTHDNTTIQIYLNEYRRVLKAASKNIEILLQNKEDHKKNRMALSVPTPNNIEVVSKGIKEIVDIMINRKSYGLSIKDVLYLSNIIMIMTADDRVVHYIKVDGTDRIQLSAKDGLYLSTKLFLEKIAPKKVVFTSATFRDFDYSPVFGEHDTTVMKDTMSSNAPMIVYPDTYMLDTIKVQRSRRMDVLRSVEEYAIKYPDVRFVCMKQDVSQWLEKSLAAKGIDINVDYYRSDMTLGVASDDRRCVCVGPPTSPINAHDAISQSYDESQMKRVGENHAAFWQAASRFKDPAGIVPSHIHCIGITENEAAMMLRWGTGRELNMSGIRCNSVKADRSFSEVTILSKDEMKVLGLLQNCGFDLNKVMETAPRKLKEKNIIPMIVHLKKLGLMDKESW